MSESKPLPPAPPGDAAPPRVLVEMLAMWNERDVSRVGPRIEAVFSPEVVFIDPANSIVGHAAFDRMVRAFRRRFPEADLGLASAVDSHHRLHRYHWKIEQAGQLLLEGFDVTEVDEAGRVARVLGFFGPIQAIAPASAGDSGS